MVYKWKTPPLQLNQATDAFRVMLPLADLPPDTVLNAQRLAEAESIRGTEGGFVLAKPVAEISLLDVITAMEGPVAIHRCLAECEAVTRIVSVIVR